MEVSWAKTYKEVFIQGSKATCELEEDERKQSILVILKKEGEKEKLKIPGQGRDSHQLQIVDFITRVSNNKGSFADENIAHRIQTIISASYLSNLERFESKRRKRSGKPVSPKKLDDFYNKFIESGCPKNIILEEIIYKFMNPFISGSE